MGPSGCGKTSLVRTVVANCGAALVVPDFSREFILTNDISNDGAGAVLSQDHIGKDVPIAYASCSFNKAVRNYSTVEKELAAIVWGIKHF